MARPLKIAMPTPSFLPNMGGMEVGLHNIASRLAKRGHLPTVIMPAGQYLSLKRTGRDLPYKTTPFWPRMSGLGEQSPVFGQQMYMLFFKRYAFTNKPDVWHSTMIYPVATALARAFGTGCPALARAAGADIQINEDAGYGFRRDPRVEEIVRAWGHQLPVYVAITETVSREYRELGIEESKIRMIPNGVERDRFSIRTDRAVLQRRYGIDPSPFLFLSVGRNHSKKNYPLLLQAVRRLKSLSLENDFRVAIVGTGVEELQGNFSDLHDKVYFIDGIGLGDDEDQSLALPAQTLVDLYTGADAFIFTSRIETFGIAIVEAMAAGLPCLVADAPGSRDVTANGQYALDFSPDDSEALAHHMIAILRDPRLRENYSHKALERSRSYDWDEIVALYETLYYELAGD